MQLAGVACCGHGDKAFLFIVRGQKPLTRTERERVLTRLRGIKESLISAFWIRAFSCFDQVSGSIEKSAYKRFLIHAHPADDRKSGKKRSKSDYTTVISDF